jgi:hypothetical protein
MRTGLFAWLGALLFMLGCTAAEKPAPTPASVIRGSGPFAFPAIDDNLAHDTLLIQTTFDLGDMTYLMVASKMEETFEGLRLYRYRFAADSAVEMMAISSPAYDSWTMLPTFFGADSTDTQALWVLANFGEKESWGQKLIRLERDFSDRGFMHVALPERVIEDDTLRLKRRNVAPQMRYSVEGDTSVWRFACDSVFLYEDGSGGVDLILAAPRVRYTYHREHGLVLWVDGQARPVRSPA